jgi:hypothetical protein
MEIWRFMGKTWYWPGDTGTPGRNPSERPSSLRVIYFAYADLNRRDCRRLGWLSTKAGIRPRHHGGAR